MSKKRPKRKHQRVKSRVPSPAKRKTVRKTAAKTGRASKALPPGSVQRERAVAFLRFTHKMLTDFTMGFEDAQLTAQFPGCANHVLWTLGHIAHTNDWIATLLDGRPPGVPGDYERLFSYKSTPTGDAAAYPGIAEVRGQCEQAFDRLVAAAEALSDAQAATPAIGETGGFVSDKLDGIYKAAWHEGWHLGQIADLRRALGLPRLM